MVIWELFGRVTADERRQFACPNNQTLIIRNLSLIEDSGRYECRSLSHPFARRTVTLIITGSGSCSNNGGCGLIITGSGSCSNNGGCGLIITSSGSCSWRASEASETPSIATYRKKMCI